MSDEYIKKKDAMDKVRNNLSRFVIAIKIGDISPEDVAPVRHGRWNPFDRTYGRTIFACSECGECTDVPTEMGEPIFGYCPNCGAKMDKENEQ